MHARARLASLMLHLGLLLAMSLFWTRPSIVPGTASVTPSLLVWATGAVGRSGGGGSGGTGGDLATASRHGERSLAATAPVRRAPLGARLVALAFAEDWNVRDEPVATDLLFDLPLSPETLPEEPGLLPFGAVEIPGGPPPPSAGEGGGAGGNRGRGLGSGSGNGVGSGGPGGCCEGAFHAGSLDREPVLLFKPDDPPYPAEARARGVRGEVIFEIVVRADGSTVVDKVLRRLPYCTEIARELATRYRWKPGLKDGRPVDTVGILIVRFDLVSSS